MGSDQPPEVLWQTGSGPCQPVISQPSRGALEAFPELAHGDAVGVLSQVLNSVLAEEITIGQAAALMDLSERHARRLLAAYRELGAGALAHGNRDRRPHNAVPEAVAAAVARLAATRYPGANHTHLTELLEEHEGLALSRPTVRRILTRAGMPSPRRRRPPQHRVRRERMPRAGMLNVDNEDPTDGGAP